MPVPQSQFNPKESQGVYPQDAGGPFPVDYAVNTALETFFQTHRVGDVLHGKVLRVASFGAFVEIADGIEGLCHNSEAVDDHGTTIHLEPGCGQRINLQMKRFANPPTLQHPWHRVPL